MSEQLVAKAEGAMMVPEDRAFVQALHSETAAFDGMPKPMQQIIAAATGAILGQKVRMPGHTTVAGFLREDSPPLAAIQVAAELSSGADSRGHRAARRAKILPALVSFLGMAIATPVNPVSKPVAQGIRNVSAVPYVLTEAAGERGTTELKLAAGRFLRGFYGENNWMPEQQASLLWAAVLADPRTDQIHILQKYAASRFLGTFGRRPFGHKSLIALHADLEAGTSAIPRAVRRFVALENQGWIERKARWRDYGKPPVSKRPQGETLRRLTLSTESYHAVAGMDAVTAGTVLHKRLAAVESNPNGLYEHEALVEVWAAIQERAATPDSEQERFRGMLRYMPTSLLVARKDVVTAPIGVVRILADAGYPANVKRGSFYAFGSGRLSRAIERLDRAALDWFEQPHTGVSDGGSEHPLHSDRAKLVLREAYLLDRLRLVPSGQPILDAARAQRFLAAMSTLTPRDSLGLPDRRIKPIVEWAKRHEPRRAF